MAKLGDKLHGGAAAAARTRLGAAVAATGAITYRDVVIPVAGGVRCKMRLLGHDEQMAATAAFAERVRELRLDADWLSKDTLEQERARQYLMRACRDPDDVGRQVGDAEDWSSEAINGPILIGLWIDYADMVATFDPAGADQLDPLSAEDLRDLAAAVEKKSVATLVAFGSSKLARYLLSSADQPATSLPPKSSPGSESTPTL